MTNRPTVLLIVAALLAGPVIGCAAGAVEQRESRLAEAPTPAAADDGTIVGDSVGAIGWVEAMLDAGEFLAAAEALLGPPVESVTDNMVAQLASAVVRVPRHQLEVLAAGAVHETNDPRLGPVFAELSLTHAAYGDTAGANVYARRAVEAGAEARSLDVARAVLEADLSRLLPAELIVGAVLPISGSPSNREYARLFLEGVEVAAARAQSAGVSVELMVEDNLGTPSGSVRAASALVSEGAAAILGPLSDGNLESVTRVVPGDVALLSPTARPSASQRAGIYSMKVGDPGAGRALAEAVAGMGYADAVMIHPESPEETLEAVAFEETFAAEGGIVRRRLVYLPGTTTFDLQLMEVESLLPELLVVAAPPADVELMAPQIAFFGLDTLDIQVAGTGAWTTPAVLESVARRHTDLVIAVSTSVPGADHDPAAEFVAAYEAHFRRTLRSPVPAAGYDLFRMALDAHAEGHRTAGDLVAAMDRLRSFEGATGTYSFVDGRLVRDYFPVRIYNGALHPVGTELITRPPGSR